MNIDLVRDFFFWSMLVNCGVYAFTAIAVLTMRGFVCRMQAMMFRLDEADALKSIQSYMAGYKLLITVFNFTPWLALMIIS